jgi:hypothetical protein
MTLQITNNVLTDLEKLLSQLSPNDKKELNDLVVNATKDSYFTPSPGPQSKAYFSEADILLFGGQAGGGKDLDLDCDIVTPFGFKKMRDICVGDKVLDIDGNICNVIAKSEIFTQNNCYQITFDTGESVICGAGHQWVTKTDNDKSKYGTTKTTQNIFKSELNHFVYCFNQKNKQIINVKPMESIPTQCIEVDSPTKTYLITKSFIPTHNSALINGLALNEHHNSLIVRRQFTDLQGIVRDCRQMIRDSGHDLKGFVMGNRPKYRKPNGGEVSFEGVEINGEIDYGKQGVARDFIGVDEGAQLPLDAILMIYGWNRSTTPNQRCRMVIASNPPVNSTGAWLAEFFAPWLDPDAIDPAEDGEIRYFYINEDSKSVQVDSKEPFELNGKLIYPHSRTFIKSTLADNPFLSAEYESKIQTLPEPYRSILLSGNFLSFRQDQDNQVIPTDWVRQAMARREQYPNPPEGMPLCNIGVDIAQGGKDHTVIARRYDWWFDDLIVKDGKDTPMGRDVAGLIMSHYRDNADVTLDMSGGFGSGVWECLQEVIGRQNLHAFKGAENAIYRTKEGTYGFTNARSAGYWRLREALDPNQNGGSPICLPNDKKLLQELTAPTFEVTTRGIKVIPKDELIKNIGYSPDRADAVVMSYYFGSISLSQKQQRQTNKNVIKVNLGYSQRKKTR